MYFTVHMTLMRPVIDRSRRAISGASDSPLLLKRLVVLGEPLVRGFPASSEEELGALGNKLETVRNLRRL